MAKFRAFAAFGVLLAASCSQSEDESAGQAAATGDEQEIACAVGTATEFSSNCLIERTAENGSLILTINHEDGSFRRLRVMDDGSGVSAADGADTARITVFDGEIEVALGGDRYILPATITGGDAQ